ncbi:MAG: DUF4388 domain-containing protein [Chloroflexota bacterium]
MSMTGDLQGIQLSGLIQMICLQDVSAELILYEHSLRGHIFFDEGEIIQACLDQLQGEAALIKLLTWDDAYFELNLTTKLPEKIIEKSWSNLLLECMSQIDETTFDPEKASETSVDETAILLPEATSGQQPDLKSEITRTLWEYLQENPKLTAALVIDVFAFDMTVHGQVCREAEADSAKLQLAHLTAFVDTISSDGTINTIHEISASVLDGSLVYIARIDLTHYIGIVACQEARLGHIKRITGDYVKKFGKLLKS